DGVERATFYDLLTERSDVEITPEAPLVNYDNYYSRYVIKNGICHVAMRLKGLDSITVSDTTFAEGLPQPMGQGKVQQFPLNCLVEVIDNKTINITCMIDGNGKIRHFRVGENITGIQNITISGSYPIIN